MNYRQLTSQQRSQIFALLQRKTPRKDIMSRLLPEKVRLEQNCIYLDPRISFNEIDRYFFNGAAGAYFQIAVDVFTDLRYNPDEWNG